MGKGLFYVADADTAWFEQLGIGLGEAEEIRGALRSAGLPENEEEEFCLRLAELPALQRKKVLEDADKSGDVDAAAVERVRSRLEGMPAPSQAEFFGNQIVDLPEELRERTLQLAVDEEKISSEVAGDIRAYLAAKPAPNKVDYYAEQIRERLPSFLWEEALSQGIESGDIGIEIAEQIRERLASGNGGGENDGLSALLAALGVLDAGDDEQGASIW